MVHCKLDIDGLCTNLVNSKKLSSLFTASSLQTQKREQPLEFL